MMNPKDALGLMEDMAMLSASNAGVEDAMRRAAHNRSSGVAILAVATQVKLQEKDQQLSNLRRQLDKVANERNVMIATAQATAQVLSSFIRSDAARTGEKESDLRARVNYQRSRIYDQKVDDCLRDGYLTEDPRRDEEWVAVEKWYIPEHV